MTDATSSTVSQVSHMNRFLTSKENIVIELLFGWLREDRINRSMAEYIDIARRVPKITAVHAYVNERLGHMADQNYAPYSICYFKPGDRYPWYEQFPRSISIETVRKALTKFGIPELRSMAVDFDESLRAC
jgi:hypothetical protein